MADTPVVSVWLKPEFEPGLLSVVIPTYNRAALVVETLESVFKQDYRPIQIIVSDDGSTDDTLNVVAGLRPPDGIELRVTRLTHAGAPAARNQGAAASRGEYLMFLDSDDVLHEGALSVLVAGLADAEVAHGRWRDWYSSETPPRYGQEWGRQPGNDLLVDLLRDQWILPSAMLLRRTGLARIAGWDEAMPAHEDFDFLVQMALAGLRRVAVGSLVVDYRRHSGVRRSGASQDVRLHTTEVALRRVEAALDSSGWTAERRAALAWRWFWSGRMGWFHSGNAEALKRRMAEARRVDPAFRAPKAWYRWIAAVAGCVAAERFAALARLVLRRG